MKYKLIHYGLTAEQESLLGAVLPEEYELTTAECVTDLIVTDAVCSIIDTSSLDDEGRLVLIAYALDVGNQMDGTMVWLGGVEPPALSSFVCCDSFLDLLTNLDRIIVQAQARYDTMQMYGSEYAYLPKHAIEESIEADINTALHRKYGMNPDPLIVKRMRRELTALREVDVLQNPLQELAAVYELTHWLKAQNIPFFVEYVTASGLIPYLLGITQTNPLPPHTFCPKCKQVRWQYSYKDGFDIPPAVCADCGTALIRDGHNLVWQEYCSYGRIPTYGFWLPASMQEQINGWLENHWLKHTREEIWGPAKQDKCRIDAGVFYFIFALDEGEYTHDINLQQVCSVLPDKIYREDVFHYLCRHGFAEKDAFRGMNYVRKGKGFPVITDEMRTAEDRWFLNRCEATGWLPSRASDLERLLFQLRGGVVPAVHQDLDATINVREEHK